MRVFRPYSVFIAVLALTLKKTAHFLPGLGKFLMLQIIVYCIFFFFCALCGVVLVVLTICSNLTQVRCLKEMPLMLLSVHIVRTTCWLTDSPRLAEAAQACYR